MKIFILAVCWGVLGIGVSALSAQDADQIADLRKQIQTMREEFEKSRLEQERKIESLTQKLNALSPATANAPAGAAISSTTAEQQKLEKELAAELAPTSPRNANTPASVAANDQATATATTSLPAAVGRAGGAYMNISYGTLITAGWSSVADPSAQLELGDHDPQKRGFSLRNAEIAVDGAIDPYFKGFANIVLKLDNNNQTEIELEESFLESTALPANLQLKAGQYFAAFGRQNAQHPHTWSFVDQPLILGRAFGPDGLRSIGAQVSWLAPTPFYTELFLSVLDGQGGTSFSFRNPGDPDAAGVNRYAGRATMDRVLHGAQDLLFVPRLASSFELTDTQTVVAGVSGAFGPNETGPDSRTEIYGVDLFWKWKPAVAAQGFPYISWQTEALYRRFQAGADPLAPNPLLAETLTDSGVYSQVVYGFMPRWNAGFRVDYVRGNHAAYDSADPYRGERHRFSPELTFLPSEFSKIRLQYNYDHGAAFGTAHSIWLQVEFGLGAHAAHKF
jgi:hypothetical protein